MLALATMPVCEIIPGLYQSGSLLGEPSLPELDVVVGLETTPDPEPIVGGCRLYVHWPIEDGPLPDLELLWDLAALLAGRLAAGERVLVHCSAGVNRSGLLNAAVLMCHLKLAGAEAVARVRQACPGALQNERFASYLESLPGPRGRGGYTGGAPR